MKKVFATAILLLAAASAAAATHCLDSENYGVVTRITPRSWGVEFNLKDGVQSALLSSTGVYVLYANTYYPGFNPYASSTGNLDQNLFQVNSDLILDSFKRGVQIGVRTTNCTTKNNYSPVYWVRSQ